MKKNIRALILFLLCFGYATAQEVAVDSHEKEEPKKETSFHPSGELNLGISLNMSQTYNGVHTDLLPTAVYGARIGYKNFSVFGHGINCFSSLPMAEQKYKILTGELCFGVALQENNKNTTTIKVGKFLFSGKYGLAGRRQMFSSTDVLYDMFTMNNDRALNRGCAIIHNTGKFNFAAGYTEQDMAGGFHFNGDNANMVVSGGYDGQFVSAQIVAFYSLQDAQTELNFYVMCTPNQKDVIIGKALGITSKTPMYEIAYTHMFQYVKLGAVVMAGKDGFTNVDCTLVLPHNVSLNVGVVNNDPYVNAPGLNPKIGIGFCHQLANTKSL